MDEEKKVKKTKVQSMSKMIVIWIIVILSILSIVDIVHSSQNGTSSWIITYMWKHYPYVIDAFSESESSSSSSSDVAATEIEYPKEESVVEEVVISPFNEDGFIFQDSSENYLDKESIYNLNDFEDYEFKDLLGYARNEIYARHGFAFKKNGKYDNFYTQYDWYNEIEHGSVSDSDLNEYEVANIALIVQVEEKEGFR